MRYFKIFVALAVALTATFTMNAQKVGAGVIEENGIRTSFVDFVNGLTIYKEHENRYVIFDVGDAVMEDVYVEIGYTGEFWKTYYVNTGTVDVAGTKIRCDYTAFRNAIEQMDLDETLNEPFIKIATRNENGQTTTLLDVVGADARYLMN
jgi:hypothetical protein